MTPARILAEFEALACRLGIEVRVEAFEKSTCKSRGGLCYVRGQPLLLIDDALATADRIGVMAASLARFDLEGIYVPPLVRARIDACADGRGTGIGVAPVKGR